tara:strand:+ start:1563 stop:1724 length:162 start_codon:yes stop_codon:yes gene_type:complete
VNRLRNLVLTVGFLACLTVAAFVAALIYCPIIAATALLVVSVVALGGILGVNP